MNIDINQDTRIHQIRTRAPALRITAIANQISSHDQEIDVFVSDPVTGEITDSFLRRFYVVSPWDSIEEKIKRMAIARAGV